MTPRIFLGMPGYGDVSAAAARAFWRATRTPDSHVHYKYNEGSLLAANFNALWCDAMNLHRMGAGPHYFAMQHADVEPPDWWLDDLIAEMEARGLDVLGVAVPIKDANGLTSIALGRDDGDTWRPLARLTMSDLRRLPPTFTSEDVGHPILLNTGLWVCRFDPAWAAKVRFTINDRIVQTPDGTYTPQCEPEDWYFSRLLHELGLKVGCTRKVAVTHRGPWRWSNQELWGQPHDAAWTDASPIVEGGPAFVLPAINGWLTWSEGKALTDLARGRRVLEIGSYEGLSTVCLARTAARVTAVDWFDGRGTAVPRDTRPAFEANLARYGVADKVAIRRPDEPLPWGERYDLVFVDGAHDRASVEADIARAVDVLAPGGLIAFHDYGATDVGVLEAVDAFAASGAAILSVTDSLAVVQPPASLPLEV